MSKERTSRDGIWFVEESEKVPCGDLLGDSSSDVSGGSSATSSTGVFIAVLREINVSVYGFASFYFIFVLF